MKKYFPPKAKSILSKSILSKNAFPLLLFVFPLAISLFPIVAIAKNAGPIIRSVTNPSGVFSFCLAEQKYSDGRKLTVAMSPANEINLGLTIPGGNFDKGKQYDLTLALEYGKDKSETAKNYTRSVRAEALDDTSLLFKMGGSKQFAKAFRNSEKLSVSASGKSVSFALPNMEKIFGLLESCNFDNLQSSRNPSAKTEHEMPEPLKALLISAGFKNIQQINMENTPEDERPFDYIWKTGNIVGGIRERLLPQKKDLDELVGLHLRGLNDKCRGNFKSEIGNEEIISGLKMRNAEAECSLEKSANGIAVAILFYLTDAGRFTVFTYEGTKKYKAETIKARNAIKRKIIELAKEAEHERSLAAKNKQQPAKKK